MPGRMHWIAAVLLWLVSTLWYSNLGGAMDAAEVARFEALPWYREAVRLRRYDDDGKVQGLTIEPVSAYRESMTALLRR